LERFRRPAGVPPAATDELASELIEVFSTLDEVEEEARAIRDEASREAARRIDAATVAAETALAEWRRRAQAERVRAESERHDEIAAGAEAIEARARAEARRLLERGHGRIPALVADVVSCITGEQP
jgi:vacuolar-type H+-ATPase subunit H